MGMTLMPNPGGSESFVSLGPSLYWPWTKWSPDVHLQERIGLVPDSKLLFSSIIFSSDKSKVEIIRPLRVANILENVAQLKHCVQEVAGKGKPRSTIYSGKGPVPMSIIRENLKDTPCKDASWIYYGTAYGPEHIRKYKLDIVQQEFMKVPGAKKVDPDTIPPEDYFWARHRVASGIPDLQELDWLNWLPNGAHVFFSPISPTKGKDAEILLNIARKRHQEFGIDLFPAFCVGLREMHLIINMVYDRGDPDSRRAAYACMKAMIDDAAREGYGEYRTHLLLQDQVAGTYNWNNNALGSLNQRLKDALDPSGILAPGRCGIWPSRYSTQERAVQAIENAPVAKKKDVERRSRL
jgi:hypothetical protein